MRSPNTELNTVVSVVTSFNCYTATRRTSSKRNVVRDSGPLTPRYENVTWSTKPELHNLSQRRQSRTEQWHASATCAKNSEVLSRGFRIIAEIPRENFPRNIHARIIARNMLPWHLSLCEQTDKKLQTDRQTNRHTHCSTSHPSRGSENCNEKRCTLSENIYTYDEVHGRYQRCSSSTLSRNTQRNTSSCSSVEQRESQKSSSCRL